MHPKKSTKRLPMASVLNGIYERNDTRINLGTGILLPLPKPKKARASEKFQAYHLAGSHPEIKLTLIKY